MREERALDNQYVGLYRSLALFFTRHNEVVANNRVCPLLTGFTNPSLGVLLTRDKGLTLLVDPMFHRLKIART